MDWIRVDTSLPDHYKLGRMGQDEDAELGRIIRFWVWAKRVCTSGCLSGLSDSEIERHAKLPDGWLARARIAGFVDGEPNDSSVHGWLDFQGADARTAALAAERQRAHRKRKSVTGRNGGALRSETVDRQDRTRQDKTRQDKSLSAPAQPSPGAPVFDLPCKGGWTYHVTDWEVAQWTTAYPGIDIMGELRKMLAWLTANPGRVKTARGMPRFVVSWLGRAEPSVVNGSPPAGPDPSKTARAERIAKMNAFLAAHPQILDTRRPEEKIP